MYYLLECILRVSAMDIIVSQSLSTRTFSRCQLAKTIIPHRFFLRTCYPYHLPLFTWKNPIFRLEGMGPPSKSNHSNQKTTAWMTPRRWSQRGFIWRLTNHICAIGSKLSMISISKRDGHQPNSQRFMIPIERISYWRWDEMTIPNNKGVDTPWHIWEVSPLCLKDMEQTSCEK